MKLHSGRKAIEEYCLKNQITIVKLGDADYPVLLAEISDPPAVLYIKGKLNALAPMIGVVGTRHVTEYGRRVTKGFTRALVRYGFTIVSGFMYGVDACAHSAAIESGGTTVGVLGFGFEYMYPKSHLSLVQQMTTAGNCLITEYAPWEPPRSANFPRRNRIVAGMSLGILVTEAASRSGSRITARLAADQGRGVFAVSGPIDSPFSEGTKDLVNLGAKLVTKAQDILDELPSDRI